MKFLENDKRKCLFKIKSKLNLVLLSVLGNFDAIFFTYYHFVLYELPLNRFCVCAQESGHMLQNSVAGFEV